ncbi:protein kinase family protein [Schinkia azotoformans MEV2011]|uniref:non-specific serine/threonine protein kinase n=1 Tax=Schinkia azotoformans MEV2011 TaxID=1348973 RepID=A0A072NSU4_SCHAZ|nr:serine/threonine-protein kinase [Schinkia azotoformans]KEF36295.1 protein kinase family protein [Schinkia azotoformans MEV2011]MEC1697878.1 serine/threonine-protein kinase [Schinkia azotoformans]MEC1723157.1 serine/threonine-protein kinase [Schinkia azotoformans]MEC1771869.1 serine/threonine-protein kinase [Schinkia azotoformans]MEC1780279.1 serine/threonine-protein kinase [Schinkia azotoformans]
MAKAITERDEPYLYFIKEEIGGGGFGTVYKGNGILEDEIVAIKILNKDEVNDVTLRRFEREIRIQKQLKHPNIVQIIDYSLDDSISDEEEMGLAYYSMPLAENNFRKLMIEYRNDNLGKMDDETAAFYFRQILDGIEYAHKNGIIHRDLKPENILVYKNDLLKISDFGLGKFLESESTVLTSQGLGTENYAAPEQTDGSNDVDERTDIYALGKILYEMITGKAPIFIDPDLIKDSKLSYLIKKATQEKKSKRYKSIGDMRKTLDLVTGDNSAFRNIVKEFNDLIEVYNRENHHSQLGNILQLLITNSTDYDLYTEHFMKFDLEALTLCYKFYREEFLEVVSNYTSIINTGHSFSFTDSIADFLINICHSTDNDIDFFSRIAERILTVGYDHNRFYVGEVFGKLIAELNDDHTEHALVLEDIFEDNRRATRWMKSYILQHRVQRHVSNLLTDY